MAQSSFWLSAIVEFVLWLILLRYLLRSFTDIVAGKANSKYLWIRSFVCLLLFYGAFVACPLVRESEVFKDAVTQAQSSDEGK